MVQNYICSMIQSNCQVLNRTFAKLVHSKHVVVNVGDAIDIVFKYINSKGVMEICIETKRACYRKFTRPPKNQSSDQRVIVSLKCAIICMCHSTVFNSVYSHNCIAAIQPHTADQGEFCIGPVQTLIKVVHCQTYREREWFYRRFKSLNSLYLAQNGGLSKNVRVNLCLSALPVGHWMSSSTSVSLIVPSIAAVSILGWFPQSAQYILLMREWGNICLITAVTAMKSLVQVMGFSAQNHSPSLRVDYNGIRLINHARDESFPVVPSA